MKKYSIQDLHNDAKQRFDELRVIEPDRAPDNEQSFVQGFCEGSFHGYGLHPDIEAIARTALTMQNNPPVVEVIHEIAAKVKAHYLAIDKTTLKETNGGN